MAFFREAKGISQDVEEGSNPNPIYNRISTKIHEAAEQFEAVNPSAKHPNVLVFITYDDFWDKDDLFGTITGNFEPDNEPPTLMFIKYSHGRIKDEKFQIHLYIWMYVLVTKSQPKGYSLFNVDDLHYRKLYQLFNFYPEKLTRHDLA